LSARLKSWIVTLSSLRPISSIPGVKPEDIDVSITGDALTIKGETHEEKETKEGSYHLRE
jgi:HSP20 family molecular chaperone IbpA